MKLFDRSTWEAIGLWGLNRLRDVSHEPPRGGSPSRNTSGSLNGLGKNESTLKRVKYKTIDASCRRPPLAGDVQRGHVVPNKELGQKFGMHAGAEVQPGLAELVSELRGAP